MHRMWSGRFRSFWNIWGDGARSFSIRNEGNMTYIRTGKKSSWAEGILLSYETAVKKTTCEYFFTHDDDLRFYASDVDDHRPVAIILESALAQYRPAIVAFPWLQGDQTIPAMKSMAALNRGRDVVPLTGFDSGMVLYHRSIVEFFIPFSPRGEGGFKGEWSLCAIFLNMFAPLIFKGNAIRLNSLNYDNLINIDNVAPKNRGKALLLEDGTIKHPESRHPYEYRYNEAYEKFLTSGLRDPEMHWGRYLEPEDVTWTVSVGQGAFDKNSLLSSLVSFYDITHPGIKNNVYMEKYFSPTELRQALSNLPFTLSIHIYTSPSRYMQCEHLLTSINKADGITESVAIYFHLDWATDAYNSSYIPTDDENTTAFLAKFKAMTSSHGKVHVKLSLRRREYRYQVLEGWKPKGSSDEYGIILDDDAEVSVYFFQYVKQMVGAYFYGSGDRELVSRLFGISLHGVGSDEVNGGSFPTEELGLASNGNQPFLYQFPDVYGAVYSGQQWLKFLGWYLQNQNLDPLVPYSLTNRWSAKYHWRKYLLRNLYARGMYLAFPNFGGNYGVVSVGGHRPMGLHLWGRGNFPSLIQSDALDQDQFGESNVKGIASLDPFTLSIDTNKITLRDSIIVDTHAKKASVDTLEKDATQFDKCTMIITVYDRYEFILERVKHYHTFPFLASMVIIWNNLNVTPPVILPGSYNIPIHILKQSRNSLNNRFYPWPEITTPCVVNMDDDWDMPLRHLNYVIDAWRKQFWNNLVGFRHQGRSHAYVNGKWEYSVDNSKGISIVLPSGFVYDRKFLSMYTYDLPSKALNMVDELMNCDDILFNFMIANHTQSGPVVVNYFAKAIAEIGIKDGLWTRGSHFPERSYCMNKFAEMFGGMPLKFLTSGWFSRESELKRSRWVYDVPRVGSIQWATYDEVSNSQPRA